MGDAVGRCAYSGQIPARKIGYRGSSVMQCFPKEKCENVGSPHCDHYAYRIRYINKQKASTRCLGNARSLSPESTAVLVLSPSAIRSALSEGLSSAARRPPPAARRPPPAAAERRPRTPPPSPLSVSPPLMLSSRLTRLPYTRCRRRHCLPRRSSLTCPAQRGQGRGSVSLGAAGTGAV